MRRGTHNRASLRPAPRRRTPRSRRAFTLVEILIVLCVVGTLAVTAVPTLSSSLESMKATGLAREIATDMRYAQTLAIKTGDQHMMWFWPPGQVYAVAVSQGAGWMIRDHPITKKPWCPWLDQHSRYAGITMREANFNGNSYVIFDEYGAPDHGGYVSFTLGEQTRTIRVAPLSGKITVE